MSTGNEIDDLYLPRDQSGQRGRDGWTGTIDTNRPSLIAALQGMGYEAIDCGIVPDELRTFICCAYLQVVSHYHTNEGLKGTPRP